MYMMYANQPTPEEIAEQEKATQEQIDAEERSKANAAETLQNTSEDYAITPGADSTQLADLRIKIGAFAYSASLVANQEEETIIENEVLYLKVSNKGGYFSELKLKNFVNHDSVPIYLIKDHNAVFNINFGTTDNRTLNTKDLYFQPSITKNGDNQVLSMKLKVSETQFLEYRYELKPNDYMLGFSVRSQGLNNIINGSQEVTSRQEHNV
jgi:YidC/Oxa1 family membrane protein insertase